jgi:L-lactate dehydrogenase complex protein LldG
MIASQQELLELFGRYARAAGAQVSIVHDNSTAAAAIIAQGHEGIICTAAVREFFPGVYRALAEAGQQVVVADDIASAAPTRSELARALAGGTGVVLAQAGVAETASLVLADDDLAPRLLSMLADVCVVLLRSSAIVPGLDEAGALINGFQRTGHRYISLVTGPSRTADIERVLTIGVQGPKALHIVVIDK